MKVEEIIKIIEALGKTDLSEFHLEQKEFTLKMGKGTTYVSVAPEVRPEVQMEAPKNPVVEMVHQKEEKQQVVEAKPDNLIKVTSPMVGTFYQSPSPDSPAFVTVGDSVDEGDVLCIIEAMKLMNEIEAIDKGKIVKVLVENGELVEYGQTLFLIEPF